LNLLGEKRRMTEVIHIQDKETAQDLLRYIQEDKPQYTITSTTEGIEYQDDDYQVTIPQEFAHLFQQDEYNDPLIYGKNTTQKITALEVVDDTVQLYFNDGSVDTKPMVYWILANKKLDKHFERLEGNQHYKWIRRFRRRSVFAKFSKIYWKKDIFKISNDKESAMIYYGYTMFKGLKVSDVSVLSFDIETNGLTMDADSEVFLITNTFRGTDGNITKKHFRVDHYTDQVEMIEDWCKWVVDVDPTVLNGHNIFGFDLPFLKQCYGGDLPIGRRGTPASTDKNESYFRWKY
jgi:DNA polymerase elongation subunit (family B)